MLLNNFDNDEKSVTQVICQTHVMQWNDWQKDIFLNSDNPGMSSCYKKKLIVIDITLIGRMFNWPMAMGQCHCVHILAIK